MSRANTRKHGVAHGCGHRLRLPCSHPTAQPLQTAHHWRGSSSRVQRVKPFWHLNCALLCCPKGISADLITTLTYIKTWHLVSINCRAICPQYIEFKSKHENVQPDFIQACEVPFDVRHQVVDGSRASRPVVNAAPGLGGVR